MLSSFFNFQVTFSQLILHLKIMLKLFRVTKVKLVYVFILANFSFEFSATIFFGEGYIEDASAGISISTDVRQRASATSIRDTGYFLPKLK